MNNPLKFKTIGDLQSIRTLLALPLLEVNPFLSEWEGRSQLALMGGFDFLQLEVVQLLDRDLPADKRIIDWKRPLRSNSVSHLPEHSL